MATVMLSGASSCILLAQHKKKKKKQQAVFPKRVLGAEHYKKQDVTSKHLFPRYEGPAFGPPPVMSPLQMTQSDQASTPEHDGSPVCIFPDQIAKTPQILTYKCSTWSRRNSVILNVLDQPVLNIRSKAMTMTRERQLRNAANNQTLMTIHRQIWTAGPPYYQFLSTTGVELLRLDRRWQYGTSRMVASFINTITGQLQHLTMDGDWSSINATVRDASNEALLAEFCLNLRKWKQTYTVTIRPNVDVALILGMLVCFNDREGHDFHFGSPNEMKLARQNDHEHAAKEKRQIQLSSDRQCTPTGHLDGAVADMVRQHRKAFTRSLHRREKRFKGPGQHLQKAGPDQDLRQAHKAADVNAVRAASLAASV